MVGPGLELKNRSPAGSNRSKNTFLNRCLKTIQKNWRELILKGFNVLVISGVLKVEKQHYVGEANCFNFLNFFFWVQWIKVYFH